MTELFSLGPIYPSDFLKPGEKPRCEPVELKLMLDEQTGLVRLEKTAPPEAMYGKYWYRSGINTSMRMELNDIVQSILKVYGKNFSGYDIGIWLDIACNDGTLLSFVPPAFFKIGVDPANDSFKNESSKHANHIIQDYFSADIFKKNGVDLFKKPKIITSIAMFYDLEDPAAFIQDIDKVLDDDGLWVMQLSYTPLMLRQMAFDNICHEHIYYYSLGNLLNLLKRYRFIVMDCQLNDTNGGSMRLYIMKGKGDKSLFGTQPYRDVCQLRVKSLLEWEKSGNYNGYNYIENKYWSLFYKDLQLLKTETRAVIKNLVNSGKKVWGYGASTKGNTLLQYFGLDNTLITAIADRNPDKHGLVTVGTNIPIVSEEEMRDAHPDYLLILPWHFINEFMYRERHYLESGGKFIVPCPQFKIIEK